MSLCGRAETPHECYEKHGDRFCLFVNPNTDASEIKGLNIERIALNQSATKVYIKTTQSKDDIVHDIEKMTKGGRYMMILDLENGDTLCVTEDFDVIYLNANNEVALFHFDQTPTLEYRKLRK